MKKWKLDVKTNILRGKDMTVLEQYKQSVDELVSKLDNVDPFGCGDETLELIEQASAKLKEMMEIVINTGVANGSMAAALQIMLK